LILSGAIWVAVAKSRIKHENQDDIERNQYVAVNGEEQQLKDEFELGEIDDDKTVGSPSSPWSSPPQERKSIDSARVEADVNVAGDGEFVEVTQSRERE
jgi:hypothetical protein